MLLCNDNEEFAMAVKSYYVPADKQLTLFNKPNFSGEEYYAFESDECTD
jgi:hypothetical protein